MTIVLLHSLAQSGELWRPLIDILEPHTQVLAPDARGHGKSAWDGTPFTIEDLADDVAALIAEPVPVLGMSMGGCVAIALAIRHPELVQRLVLADTTASYGPDRKEQWEKRAQAAVAKPRREQVEFQVDRWFSPDFTNSAEIARVVELFVATDSNAHAQACRALGDFDASDKLGEISCPTLVVVGEDDQATPPAMAAALADGIKGANLVTLGGARHFSLFEKPGALKMVADYLLGKEGPWNRY
ncbi:alpha/beta hydrolase [Kibdelosporangium philippinense]|uniref:Alpha/beta hydrolase n=1 Tax=Kibdelosporangium philippinense TaxID=211113 RepID=A0ABS8ZTF2_9PSEU|nr:alpha/beta fold hydrolase [Kibdelosporangium philippinense]MCE7010882.1 alpha/beta hydrolase [Kibdelosporangium philippinense]